MESLISIIVPVYNVEKYLSKCLDSLIGQTYCNLEIICVNDDSPDGSIDILREYANRDKRIKVIHQGNTGLSGARNTGLCHATGDYIMFVDSDDWVDLNICEKALQEDADIVFWSYYREYGEKSLKTQIYSDQRLEWDAHTISELHRRLIGLSGKELINPAQTDSMSTAWGKLFKCRVLKNQFFVDTKYIGTEDALFNISVFFQAKSAVYIPDIYCHYRKDNQQALTAGCYKKELVIKWRELYRRVSALLDQNYADNSFYEALENRRALGVIQLGLGISADSTMCFKHKIKELRIILTSPDYRKAIRMLPISDMPIHWKVFFIAAKGKMCVTMLIVLKIMNWLRSKV